MRKEKQINPVKEEAIISDLYDSDTIYKLDLDCIIDSTFEPQKNRVKKYKDADLDSLGNSIDKHGQRQPILVRPRRDIVDELNPFKRFFEIVFGSRRKYASVRKGLKTIKCFIEELTDAEVIELQYEENDKRSELSLLDNAYYFNFLQERFSYSEEQIADRLNVRLRDVRTGIALSHLIPEAVEQVESEKLPKKHACYMAGFSEEVQRQILAQGLPYRHGDINSGAVLFREFEDDVEENFVRDLENAPFNTEDDRLHLKKLRCSQCPQNSAFKPFLYPDWQGAKGKCLDPKCFQMKTNVNMRLKTEEAAQIIAEKEHKPIEIAVKEVPLVTERAYVQENKIPVKGNILKNQELLEKPECEFSELSVAVDGVKKGQHVYVCRNEKCPVHHPIKPLAEIPESELKARQDEFDQKIYQEQKIKVFSEAIKYFDDYKPFWMFDDLIGEMVFSFLLKVKDSHSSLLKQILKDWKHAPKNFSNVEQLQEFALSLDKRQQSQVLFLLAKIDELEADLNEPEAKKISFKKIAKDYTKLDLRRIDAELRWKHAPDEFESQAEEYFNKVINDQDAEIPRFWAK